jgi:hypothetical protein
METEYKHAIGIVLLVLGLILTFWTFAAYYALRDIMTTAGMGVSGAIAIIGLVLLIRK